VGKQAASSILGAAALSAAIFACGCGAASDGTTPHTGGTGAPDRIAEEQPPRPTHFDVATRAQEEASERAAESEARARRREARAEDPPSVADGDAMPPASAGTNGSYVPPPESSRMKITPRTIARFAREEAEGRAVLLAGIALAPPDAPEAVKAAISGANEIVGRPYQWGGGHSSWYSPGYDCSGAVSYALASGGLLASPLASGQFANWGVAGQGRWITVYANAGHAYAVIAGLRWDTVGDARGSGPRWHAALPYPETFVARHPPGF
jgi:cell wall-associated NlpC family hydrolase